VAKVALPFFDKAPLPRGGGEKAPLLPSVRTGTTGRHATRRVTIPAIVLGDAPRLDRRIWLLTVARFVVTAGFAAVMPFLAIHLAVERHIPILRIGLLWTVVGFVSASMQWVAGQAADRVGRRRVLLTAMVLRSINLAALGWAIGAHASLGVIGFLCIINGAMRAFYDPAASAVVASLSSRDDRVTAFSLHRVGSSLGWAAGPLAVTFAPEASYGAIFYVAAPITLLAAIAVSFIRETGPITSNGRKARLSDIARYFRDARFARFLLATLPFFVLQTQMYHILPIYAAKHLGLDRTQVGSLFVANGILVVLLQLPAVQIIQRIGTAGALVAGSFGYVVAYCGVGLASGYFSLLACVLLATLCEIVAVPAHQARLTGLAPADQVAGYAGLGGLVQGLAQTSGPIVGSALIDLLPAAMGWGILAVLGIVAAFGFRRRPEPWRLPSGIDREHR
jgi:MFS family permease